MDARRLLPRRVLFVDHADALGGAEFTLLMLLERLDRGLWEPHLACVPSPLAERARALGIAVHLAPLRRLRRNGRAPLTWLTGVCALARLVRTARIALMVPFSVRALLYAEPAALLTRTPLVWYRNDLWLGQSPPRWPSLERAIKRLLCAPIALMIANSHATAAQQPCRARLVVVHNGIEVHRYDPAMDGEPFRQQCGIPRDAVVLGLVGRLNPIKRQDSFLRVLARVLREKPEAWGLVVGGPIFGEETYAAGLRTLASQLGIAQRVTFAGHLADPRAALAAMDVFVQPGDPEALALSNLEAMAMGKPIVGYHHGSMPEMVLPGETGWLVPPGDEAALASAATNLVNDPLLRVSMGRAARARAEACFDARRVARDVSDLLLQALDGDPAAHI